MLLAIRQEEKSLKLEIENAASTERPDSPVVETFPHTNETVTELSKISASTNDVKLVITPGSKARQTRIVEEDIELVSLGKTSQVEQGSVSSAGGQQNVELKQVEIANPHVPGSDTVDQADSSPSAEVQGAEASIAEEKVEEKATVPNVEPGTSETSCEVREASGEQGSVFSDQVSTEGQQNVELKQVEISPASDSVDQAGSTASLNNVDVREQM